MKKFMRLSILCVAVISSVSGQSCTVKESVSSVQNISTVPESFEMPPETSDLLVYCYDMTYNMINPAVNFYNELYPEIEVTMKSFSAEEYEDILKVELASGSGPDVVLALSQDISDLYKMMLSGTFMNLDGFMTNDEEFDIDDYVPGIFNSGILRGKRYFAPIGYGAHVVLTTQEILDEEGLNLEEIQTFDGYFDSIYSYNAKYSDDPKKSALDLPAGIDPDFYEMKKLVEFAGTTYIDYENDNVAIETSKASDFRALMDAIRKIYPMPRAENKVLSNYPVALLDHTSLYSDIADNITHSAFVLSCVRLREADKTPVIFIPQNPDGTITGSIKSFAAIPEGADNKLNAYRFIKTLLSLEYQGGDNGETVSSTVMYIDDCPVRKDAIYKYTNLFYEEKEDSKYTESVSQCAEVMMSVNNAVLVPWQVESYVLTEMMPYINGSEEWDTCFDNLIDLLNLYKDE